VSRVVFTGVALILAALTFDASVLLVPGVALVVLGVTVPPWIRLAARGASVRRQLHADRVIAPRSGPRRPALDGPRGGAIRAARPAPVRASRARPV
jgi:hypothetical protein